MAHTRGSDLAKAQPQTPTVQTPTIQTAPPLRRSIRSTRTVQPVHDIESDEDDSTAIPKKAAKATKKTPTPAQEATADQSPPGPRYNTRSKQVRISEPSEDVASDAEDGVEELPLWPRYKDDLPNAFNGEVDPSQDFISKAPVEIIDNILSFLILDHEPDRGVKMKEGTYDRRPHVLISMSAMSRLFYHATEGFARRFLKKNEEILSDPFMNPYYRKYPEQHRTMLRHREESLKAREEKLGKLRRSSRLADQPQPEALTIYRKELRRTLQSRCAVCFDHAETRGRFANAVMICRDCEESINGSFLTLTEALKSYDLRDYMLIKSRTPGPRAKFTDLPVIPYGSEYKSFGFPVFKTLTVFYFRRKDLRILANLVHGDWVKHINQKLKETHVRQEKSRTKRVRKFIIEYHERELEVSKGKAGRQHRKRLTKLRELAPDKKERGVTNRFGCSSDYCYHDVGLCGECGDVPGRNHDGCQGCYFSWADGRYEAYYRKVLGEPQPVPEAGDA